MKNSSQSQSGPRNTCNTKLDRTKALELHAKGLSITEIAQHQGVNRSTVWRFLRQTEPERQAVEEFKAGRADVLARLQAKSLDLQERILDTMSDRVVEALAPHQKSGLLHALNAQAGTLYDKERLERGKSTTNLGVMSRIVSLAHQNLWSDTISTRKDPDEPSK